MNKELLNKIRENKLVYSYLREDSSLYKELLRNKEYIKEIEKKAKEFYKETSIDKIERLNDKINLIKTFMDVLN
jgi:hypothetical protein